MRPTGSAEMVEPADVGRVSGPARLENAIGTENARKEVVERKIESLIRKVGYRFIDAKVFVTSIEELEDYDAGFLRLHVVRDSFSLGDIEEIRGIIEKAGFMERDDVRIEASEDGVELIFDLRW